MTKPVLAMTMQRLFEDDWIQGSSYRLVEALAEEARELHVFPLYGETLPHLENVHVRPLAESSDDSRLKKIYRLEKNFLSLVRERSLDGVFFLKYHLYAPLLAWARPFVSGPFVLFRAHGQLPWNIRLGLPFIDVVLTSSPGSFDYPTPKKKVLSEPVDLSLFEPQKMSDSETLRILSAGRISPIKGYEVLIEALRSARTRGTRNLQLNIYGEPIRAEDEQYLSKLKSLVRRHELEDVVRFHDPVPFREMPSVYARHHLFVNCPVEPSALDRVVLEAMASQRPVLTTNKKFRPILETVNPECLALTEDPSELAQKIEFWTSQPTSRLRETGEKLREIIEKEYSLTKYARNVTELFVS